MVVIYRHFEINNGKVLKLYMNKSFYFEISPSFQIAAGSKASKLNKRRACLLEEIQYFKFHKYHTWLRAFESIKVTALMKKIHLS